VTEFVGVNIGNINDEGDAPNYGLQSPDNLASDNSGNLYIVEDNSPSDIWLAGKDGNHDGVADSVALFATLTTTGAEGTGIYFPPGMPNVMLVNVQHAANGNDMTIMITAPKNGK
jgi:secreted PhoX family phosphatase